MSQYAGNCRFLWNKALALNLHHLENKQPLKKIPTFKKRGERDSFTLPQGFKLEGRHVFLPKIGWVNFRKSRDIEGTAKNVTISRQGKHWFVSIQVEVELAEPVHSSASMIGVDLGVKRLFTLSDGEFEEPIDIGFYKDKHNACKSV